MPKVMIAEDDVFMADLLGDYLGKNGFDVCGIGSTVEQAVKIGARHKPDLAVLDMRLAAGGRGTDVAVELKKYGCRGILYATGNANNLGNLSLTKKDGEACLGKPFCPEDLVRALNIVEQIARTGEALNPFPNGFRVLEAPETAVVPANDDTSQHIQRLLRQQEALARFGNFALGNNDLAEVLTEAARVCAEGLHVPFCKIFRYRREENNFIVEAGVGWRKGVVGQVVSEANDSSPHGRAFITGTPVICRDLNRDATFELPPYYAAHGIISTVNVIIKKVNGQPYGVLEVDSPVQQDYDRHDINFLTGFANVLAEAVSASKRNAVLQDTIDRMEELVAEKDQLLAAQAFSLEEKNVLAQELQHRVRNNLHLVYGMLHKQLEGAQDGPEKVSLGAIARRVMTLSKVYDHLLGTGLSRTIDFGAYLSSLCSGFEALQGPLNTVDLACENEPLALDLDSVTTLGLVITELVSNSYLHAFAGRRTGTIRVSLTTEKMSGEATLTVVDNGVGFSTQVKSKRHGLGLAKRLMQQIGGSAEVLSDHGTVWTLRFPIVSR